MSSFDFWRMIVLAICTLVWPYLFAMCAILIILFIIRE